MYNDGHVFQFQDPIVSSLPDTPEHVLIEFGLDVAHLLSVYKINVNSGKKFLITKSKVSVISWMADPQGNLCLGEALSYKTSAAIRV